MSYDQLLLFLFAMSLYTCFFCHTEASAPMVPFIVFFINEHLLVGTDQELSVHNGGSEVLVSQVLGNQGVQERIRSWTGRWGRCLGLRSSGVSWNSHIMLWTGLETKWTITR